MKRVLAAAAIAAASWPSVAAAEIHVRAPECATPAFDYDEFIEVLRVEMAPDPVVTASEARSAGPDTVSLDLVAPCRPDGDAVTLRVHTAERLRAARSMDIGDLPMQVRARGIAVVAAELIRSAKIEALPEPKEMPPPEPAPAPSPPSPPPRRASIPWDVHAAGEARIFVLAPTLLIGGNLGVHVWRARARLALLRGQARDAIGDATVMSIGGSLGFDVVRLETSMAELAIVPRIGAALLVAEGTASRYDALGRSVGDPYFDVALELDGRARLGRGWWATFDLDVGFARGLVLRADHQRTMLRPDGPFFGFRLGVAFGSAASP